MGRWRLSLSTLPSSYQTWSRPKLKNLSLLFSSLTTTQTTISPPIQFVIDGLKPNFTRTLMYGPASTESMTRKWYTGQVYWVMLFLPVHGSPKYTIIRSLYYQGTKPVQSFFSDLCKAIRLTKYCPWATTGTSDYHWGRYAFPHDSCLGERDRNSCGTKHLKIDITTL